MDFSPRSTSPMNFPERLARSPSRSWLRLRCLRSARRRWPKNFRTCLTARSVTAFVLALGKVVLTLPVSGPVRNSLDGLGPARHEGQHQGPVVAHDRVDAARGAPGVVAPGDRKSTRLNSSHSQ